MTEIDNPTEHGVDRPGKRLWQILALLFALFVIGQDTQMLLWHLQAMPNAGMLAAVFQQSPSFARGLVAVTQIMPDGPMATAGVERGDHLRFERTYDYIRPMRSGERSRFLLGHRGSQTQKTVQTVPRVASESEQSNPATSRPNCQPNNCRSRAPATGQDCRLATDVGNERLLVGDKFDLRLVSVSARQLRIAGQQRRFKRLC